MSVIVGCLLLSACGQEAVPKKLTSGKALYGFYCAACHLDSGEGRIIRGAPPIRDTRLSYRQLVDRIQGHERPADSRMPKFDLSKKQAEAIAIYLRQKLKAD